MSAAMGETFGVALALHREGRLDEAACGYRAVLAVHSDHPDSLHLLGVIAQQQGRPLEAEPLMVRALARRADDGVDDGTMRHNLAGVLRSLGRLDEAVVHQRRAVALLPDWACAHNHLGVALHELGCFDEAMACYQRALTLDPEDASGHNNLGVAYQDQGELDQALACYRRALNLDPGYADAGNNLGNALKEQGRAAEAVVCYEALLETRPELSFVRSNLLFTRMALPETTLPEIAAAARRWEAVHAASYRAEWKAGRSHAGDDDSGAGRRRLRLGFVSGDFRRHAVGFLVIAVFEALARAGHELVCYSNGLSEDALTGRFRAAAVWRPILGLDDDAVAAQIRADGIDILFDLSGHTAQNRLLVFARKPAPIQVTWVGYVATTGLEAMTYWLADDHQIPESAERWYRERIIRMPGSYVCWEAPDEAPPITPLPAARNGVITFGSFNFLSKITPEVVAVWSRILGRVPDSRLLLKAVGFNCPATRDRFRALFADHGVADPRLVFVGGTSRAEHLAWTAEADIALDSFPYSGGLTTLETLWMGVPVVTCPGETLCSRHAYGYLATLGCRETIARDFDHYVDLAAAWAGDCGRLASVRAALRPQMLASPLLDASAFVRAFEAACQAAWACHRAGRRPRAIRVRDL